MLKTTLASLRAHAARLVFSSLAIVLGVGFAAGTFVLTDTIEHGYESSFAADAKRLDVVAQPSGSSDDVPPGLVDDVRDTRGVAHAEARYSGAGQLLDSRGRPVGEGPSAKIDTVAHDHSLRWQPLATGKLPSSGDDVALDTVSAKRSGYRIGDSVKVLDADDKVRTFTLVGTVDLADSPQYAGGQYVGVTAGQAKQLSDFDTETRIDIAATGGASATTVRKDVAATMPGDWDASTGEQYTQEQLKEISGQLAQVKIGLLAFAAIALFVAAIVIANTFTILVAQRSREMALLRCVGATRAQVYRSVLVESLLLGVVGSALGLLAGIGIAALAQMVLANFDAPLPGGMVTPSVLGLALPFALGVVVTVLAAVFPAVGATRIAPVAALRNQPDVGEARKTHRIRTAFALLLVAAGGAAMAPGAVGDGSQNLFMLALGGGALAFLGVLLLTPVLVPALIRVIGWLVALPFGTPGKLARANGVRNPGRAAATSAALLVGVTLISIMTVVSASVQKTATAGLDEEFPFDLSVTSRHGQVPQSVVDRLKDKDELSAVVPIRTARASVGKAEAFPVQGADREELRREFGSLDAYDKARPGKVVLPKSVAYVQKVGKGDPVTVKFADGRSVRLKVAGLVSADNAIVSTQDLHRAVPHPAIGSLFVKADHEVPAEDVQTAVDDAIAGHPDLATDGPLQYRSAIEKGIEVTLLLFAGLLGVAVLIALFGIANTLALSVLERTRESGVLRALGLTRGQLRGMLSGEAVLLSAVAGLLGVVLGVGFGYVAVSSLVGHDTAELVVPAGRLGAFVGLAAVAGLVASLLPARKAARSSAVAAMAEE